MDHNIGKVLKAIGGVVVPPHLSLGLRRCSVWDRDHLLRIRLGGMEIPANSVDEQLRRLEVRRAREALAVALAYERGDVAAAGRHPVPGRGVGRHPRAR